jgi:hypothetical protein
MNREPIVSPEELFCPVCERVIPSPAPENCPHCDAPINTIVEVFRTADNSIDEAMRDLKIGDLESAEGRLSLVRLASRRHRLKVEIIQAMIDRLRENCPSALARLQAVRGKLTEDDEEILSLLENVESRCVRDQEALALCCEHYNFALFEARRGHLEESRRSLRHALDEVPHHSESHALLGKVQLALGEEDDAYYHLRRALAADSSNTTATRLLAKMRPDEVFNPFEYIKTKLLTSPVWAATALALLILAVLAVVAVLGR